MVAKIVLINGIRTSVRIVEGMKLDEYPDSVSQ